ncbi:MAG TPA: histidine kinase dimerization/phospho-acceptor domain-containing protein, partial [Thermoanaerobaculia bacterium]
MSPAVRYTIAVVVTATAIVLTLALPQFLAPMRLFFLWCAVLICALAGGTGPGLLSVIISVIAASIVLFRPFGSLGVHFTEDVLRLALFGAFAAALSVAVGERRRAQMRAAGLNAQLRNEVQERKRHQENAAFISHASELLATSLSHIETMRNLARLCVPAMGDWCAVHIGADENYERLAIEHRDPAKLRMLEDLGRLARPAPDKDAIYSVLTTRKTQLVAEFPEETLRALSLTSVQFELLQNLGFRSWIIAPMIARGRVLGALTVVCGESGRRYSEQDVPLIEDLARRAAVAIDNARLYEAAEAANRAKDEFLATLSHELRTPLTAISGWAHMLDLGMTDEATTKLAVGTIIRSAKAQAELIDDLLDLSRVVAGTLRL